MIKLLISNLFVLASLISNLIIIKLLKDNLMPGYISI